MLNNVTITTGATNTELISTLEMQLLYELFTNGQGTKAIQGKANCPVFKRSKFTSFPITVTSDNDAVLDLLDSPEEMTFVKWTLQLLNYLDSVDAKILKKLSIQLNNDIIDLKYQLNSNSKITIECSFASIGVALGANLFAIEVKLQDSNIYLHSYLKNGSAGTIALNTFYTISLSFQGIELDGELLSDTACTFNSEKLYLGGSLDSSYNQISIPGNIVIKSLKIQEGEEIKRNYLPSEITINTTTFTGLYDSITKTYVYLGTTVGNSVNEPFIEELKGIIISLPLDINLSGRKIDENLSLTQFKNIVIKNSHGVGTILPGSLLETFNTQNSSLGIEASGINATSISLGSPGSIKFSNNAKATSITIQDTSVDSLDIQQCDQSLASFGLHIVSSLDDTNFPGVTKNSDGTLTSLRSVEEYTILGQNSMTFLDNCPNLKKVTINNSNLTNLYLHDLEEVDIQSIGPWESVYAVNLSPFAAAKILDEI